MVTTSKIHKVYFDVFYSECQLYSRFTANIMKVFFKILHLIGYDFIVLLYILYLFNETPDGEFINADNSLRIPSLTDLRELIAASKEIEKSEETNQYFWIRAMSICLHTKSQKESSTRLS